MARPPKSLSDLIGFLNCAVQYFTGRFHAKVYVFDQPGIDWIVETSRWQLMSESGSNVAGFGIIQTVDFSA
ncbi:MAG TPA: hypothetical protein VFB79_09720 [Candidatus Angelobacter sp.]|nr:hypothetical protein [Candidatus Angelobacter sp.]